MIVVTAAIPMVCYGVAAVILLCRRDYPDALMFGGYAFAGYGILWRLW